METKQEIKQYDFYLPEDIDKEQPYFSYIKISELPEIEQEHLIKWLYGQTVPLIDGEGNLAYLMDYIRFRRAFYRGDVAVIYD